MTTRSMPDYPRALMPLATSEDRPAWLEARAPGVTASEIPKIAAGGRRTWKRMLDDKLNGESFHGNAQTHRGRMREPFLLAHAATIADVQPNAWLFAHPESSRFMATPDGIGHDPEREGQRVGVEVKSHAHGWSSDEVPADHYDQCQWGMLVTDATRWLYVWEVMGEDGEPTLDTPHHVWIERDETRISELISEALNFLEWWEAGAPLADDDIDPAVDDALADWARARARKNAALAEEKAAEKIIRDHIAKTEGAEEHGLKESGRRAHFNYSVTTDDVLDAEEWAASDPNNHAAWLSLRARMKQLEDAAATKYTKESRSTRLVITAHKEAA